MKKLIAMIGAVALAFGLYADDPVVFEGTSFETDEAGVEGSAWSPEGDWTAWTDADPFELGAYAGDEYKYASDKPRRDGTASDIESNVFPKENINNSYLKLSTGTNVLNRAVANKNYFDQVVKFTGFEEAQTNFVDGTKIAIWTSAIESNGDVAGDTNLYVAVGTGALVGPIKNVKINVGGDFDFTAWHRVTIRNVGAVSGTYAGFLVWIDGVMADTDDDYFVGQLTAYEKYYNAGQLFIAMEEGTTVNSVGFAGQGAIDDVAVTSVGPKFTKLSVEVTVAPLTDMEIVSVVGSDGVTYSADAQGKYNIAPGITLTITFKAVDGSGKMLTKTTLTTGTIDNATTIDPAEYDVEAKDIIATVTIDGGESAMYYDITNALNDIIAAEAKADEINVDINKGFTGAQFGDNVISLVTGASIEIAPAKGSWLFKNGNVTLVADVAAEKSVTVRGDDFTLSYGGTVAGELKAAAIEVAAGKTIAIVDQGKVITKTPGLENTIVAPTDYKVIASAADEKGYITYMIGTVEYVAQIGDDMFTTLQAALDVGGNIKLLADISITDKANQLFATKDFVLDLNNKTISGSWATSYANAGSRDYLFELGAVTAKITGSGTVTTTVGQIGGFHTVGGLLTIDTNVVVDTNWRAAGVYSGATLVVDGTVKTKGEDPTIMVIANGTKCTVTINGTVQNDGAAGNVNLDAAIMSNGSDTIGMDLVINGSVTAANVAGVYAAGAGTVTVNKDATIAGATFGIYAKSGTITVNGGAISASAAYVAPTAYNNGIKGAGVALVLESGAETGGYANNLQATIAGGTFTAGDGAPAVLAFNRVDGGDALVGFISAGEFKGTEMPVDYIALTPDQGYKKAWVAGETTDYVKPGSTEIVYNITFDEGCEAKTYTVNSEFPIALPTPADTTKGTFLGWTNETYTAAITSLERPATLGDIAFLAAWKKGGWDPEIDPTVPASEKGITGKLANASFAKLSAWAKNVAGIDFAEGNMDAYADAFLLNCKTDEVATEMAKFKITSITKVGDKWIVKVTDEMGQAQVYKNGYVDIISVKTAKFPTAGDGSDFFQATLTVQPVVK